MECLNQLLLNVRPSEGAGNSEQEAGPAVRSPGGEQRFQWMFHVMLIIS